MELKRFANTPYRQFMLGKLVGNYLRFVGYTSRIHTIPENFYEALDHELPFIVTMWHGEHLMVPFAKRKDHRVQVLISKNRDGEINAIAARMLGMEVVRGSGGRPLRTKAQKNKDKGGAQGLRAMLRALQSGISVSMTADIPKNQPRRAGEGIISLARLSGRPIVPVAFATTRFKRLNTWDRMVLPLPFGRGLFVHGQLIRLPKQADEKEQEKARLALEHSLNTAYDKAYGALGMKFT